MKRIVLGMVVAAVVVVASLTPTGAATATPDPDPSLATGDPVALAPPSGPADGSTVAPAAAEPLSITLDEVGPFAPGQQVVLSIVGARHLSTVVVRQCDATGESCGISGYLTVGPSGGGEVTMVVRRRLPTATADGIVDCGLEPCAFFALQYGTDLEASASTPMAVDPNAPIARPTLRIVETEPLDDYAVVTVEGTGFETQSYVVFSECGWNPPIVEVIPCVSLDAYAPVLPDGTFTTTVRVSRVLGGLDCADRFGRCQLWAFPYGSIDQIWAVQLGFDGDEPPIFPEVTVTPSTDLVHRQVVAVGGTHAPPSSSVRIAQCLATPPAPGEFACSSSVYASIDASGAFTTTFPVRRTIGTHDCATEACVVRAVGNAALTVDVPIAFDPSVPPPPPSTISVDPATGLADRQVVAVSITELEPGSYVQVATCATGTESCRGASILPVPPGGGTVTGPVTAYRIPAAGIDCAVAACEIRAQIFTGTGLELAAPISFDPDTPIADPPSLLALPNAGLWDRQQVQVRGGGYDAGSSVIVVECAGDVTDPVNCEQTASVWPSVGPDGTFDVRFTARRTPTLAGGPADCLVVSCSIVAMTSSRTVIASVPITFDPNQPPGASDLPPQLECVSWPTEGWPVGDIPAGVDAAAVEALGEQMIEYGGSSVVVIHGGKLVYENYDTANAVDENTVLPSMSMSKSFTSTMVGLLVDDGLIDIDEPGLFPEWSTPGDVRGTMTTRHLLNMSSGLQWTENYGDMTSDVIQLVQSNDGAAYVIGKPADVAPGTRWSYSTGDTMLLSRVIGDAAGVSGPTYQAMLQDRIFGPLGIDPVDVGFDGAGRWRSGWWTNTTTRNFAKLGLLYLRDGVWEDEQLLSSDWVDFVRTPAPGYSGYGGQFWLNSDGSFSMVGYGGQNVLIVPQSDLIVAVNNGGSTGSMAQLFAGAAPPTCGGDPAMALVDDAATVDVDGSVAVDVLANDDGGPSGLAPETLTVASIPEHGSAVVEAGTIRYQPDEGFSGTDSFTYVVCSTVRRPCLEATVQVTVGAPPGRAPG